MRWITWAWLLGAAAVALGQTAPATAPSHAVLFDFEGDLADWSAAKLHDVPEADPAPRVEATDQGATSGQKAMKITFAGGRWPGVATGAIPVEGNWKPYQSLRAELTVDRPTIALFRIYQEKKNDKGQEAFWTRSLSLLPGRNDVVLTIRHGIGGGPINPANGNPTRFVIGAYRPAEGQTLIVDHVRLDKTGPQPKFVASLFSPYSQNGYSAACARDLAKSMKLPTFKVLGTDWQVADPRDLTNRLAKDWKAAEPNTLEQVEADFAARYEQVRKDHPKAHLSILRDGQAGYDPADPKKAYAGWADAYINCHDPDGPQPAREANAGANPATEVFMRHRSPLMKVDLSFLPKKATIHAAQLVLPRHLAADLKVPAKPHVWVVEPCARPWAEKEVTGYWAAKDTPWKAVNGTYVGADEPDFHPVYIAYGFGNVVNVWDFKNAVQFWQENPNHGFMPHGDSNDYMRISMREEKDVSKRPAVMVIWEAP